MADTRDTTLRFDTVAEGIPVHIDGVAYTIKHPMALPLGPFQRSRRLMRRVHALAAQETTTEAEDREITEALQQVCDLILEVPDEVRARLKDAQRIQICSAFLSHHA